MGKRKYLGDGLYAEHDGYQYWLISSDWMRDLDRVALGPEVLKRFLKYVETKSKVRIIVERVSEEVLESDPSAQVDDD